jgi:stearoyl-CoA desaturase (delta-9 desaturase)
MNLVTDTIDAVSHHVKAGTVNWAMVIFLSLAHTAALWGLVTISVCDNRTLLWALFLWPVSGLGITAGAHRLWAHRSYTATWPLRLALMLMNSMANQGSVYHWTTVCITSTQMRTLTPTTHHVDFSILMWVGYW